MRLKRWSHQMRRKIQREEMFVTKMALLYVGGVACQSMLVDATDLWSCAHSHPDETRLMLPPPPAPPSPPPPPPATLLPPRPHGNVHPVSPAIVLPQLPPGQCDAT